MWPAYQVVLEGYVQLDGLASLTFNDLIGFMHARAAWQEAESRVRK